jgi:hypothetical protein
MALFLKDFSLCMVLYVLNPWEAMITSDKRHACSTSVQVSVAVLLLRMRYVPTV